MFNPFSCPILLSLPVGVTVSVSLLNETILEAIFTQSPSLLLPAIARVDAKTINMINDKCYKIPFHNNLLSQVKKLFLFLLFLNMDIHLGIGDVDPFFVECGVNIFIHIKEYAPVVFCIYPNSYSKIY